MTIDRSSLVARHSPVLTAADAASPLSVGNGGFAFTADVTGFQTLYDLYAATTPLCTMAHWGWHSFPDAHAPNEVEQTEYQFNGRVVRYAVEKKAGNEAIYDWLRQNPHRLNLGRFVLLLDGRRITPAQLADVQQTLNLWEGLDDLYRTVDGLRASIMTACAPDEDTLAFVVAGEAADSGRLSVCLDFPYGSPDISASDWDAAGRHTSHLEGSRIHRRLDETQYVVSALCPLEQLGEHRFTILAPCFSVRFSPASATPLPPLEVIAQSRRHWADFWQSGGAIDLRESADPRASELERRIVLSQYLTAIQCAGPLPPQETGLTCNSWYGKFHLEMHPSHCAWMPLWNRGRLLRRSLPWYHAILPRALENAAKNGYRGARWPKMTGPEGVDSPSPIATLLIWQQPHLIWMLELLYRERPDERLLHEHWPLVRESAEFMADFAVHDSKREAFELLPPLIPAQEEFDPRTVKNPAFEVEYWREALQIALTWAARLGLTSPQRWRDVAQQMASAPIVGGRYLAHANCPETFERFARDHPSMVFAYGMLKGERMNPQVMRTTLEKVLQTWDFSTLWGWDFGQMAMTATRLGLPELAVDILLTATDKNVYAPSGNNFQRSRRDLPLYLPGNGTLLLAAAMMCAGCDGCATATPGVARDGGWSVQFEQLNRLP